ncbi:MAG: hypothetical protein KF696_00990 [Planctomycetes bacterium]|nr:hypothetical protein [Planctomycetota bacterium]MCW8134485.1 hypothetical protein [Planctomycetota bacterium]
MTLRSAARSARARKRAFDKLVKAFAWYTGWFGMALLALCGLLWLIGPEHVDGMLGLRAAHMPLYTMTALIAASLLGWWYINKGEDRIKQHIGRTAGLVLFVILPLACMAAGLLQAHVADSTGWHPPGHPFWLIVRWYPPLLVMVSAAVFLGWKAKPRRYVYLDRALGYALLFTPYALLFAYLALGVYLGWIDDALHQTLASAGGYALVLQLVFAYFIGGD